MKFANEKRSGTRIPFQTTTELISSEGRQIFCTSQNISLSGVLLNVDEILTIDEIYQLKIKLGLSCLNEPVVILIQGRVVRQKSADVAFKFDSMDFDSYEHLKNLLKANADGIPGLVDEV